MTATGALIVRGKRTERVPGLVAVDEAGYLRCCAGGTTADGKRKPCREAEEWDLVRVVCCAKDA